MHPEAYDVARRIVQACGRDIRSLMGDSATLQSGWTRPDSSTNASALPTVKDILAELEKPAVTRPGFRTATFTEG